MLSEEEQNEIIQKSKDKITETIDSINETKDTITETKDNKVIRKFEFKIGSVSMIMEHECDTSADSLILFGDKVVELKKRGFELVGEINDR